MVTNWVALTNVNLFSVINSQILGKSNENTDADSTANYLATPDEKNVFDPALADRATDLINFVINQFRGAIQRGGKYPLSVTPNTIPIDLVKHVLNMAAFELINSTPNLQMVVVTEKGAYAPFQTFYKAAADEMENLRKGYAIILPTDPTGQDYINPINVTWGTGTNGFPIYNPANAINPPIEPVRVGGQSYPQNLQTDQSFFEDGYGCFPVAELGWP